MSTKLASPVMLLLLCGACGGDDEPTVTDTSSSSSSSSSGAVAPPEGVADASSDADAPSVDLDDRCAASFGEALTAPFGRIDGTLLAVVSPGDEQCTRPNGDHVILQVLWRGEAYRLVVNVESDRGDDRRVFVRELPHALVGPAFEEGWHTDVTLDYVNDLAVHADDAAWDKVDLASAVETIESSVVLDQHLSVFASTDGGDSAHLVHRNRNGHDGAIVLDADGPSPRWLLFHFAEQSF